MRSDTFCYCDDRRSDGTCKDCGCKVTTIHVDSIEPILNVIDAALGKRHPPPFTVPDELAQRSKES